MAFHHCTGQKPIMVPMGNEALDGKKAILLQISTFGYENRCPEADSAREMPLRAVAVKKQ